MMRSAIRVLALLVICGIAYAGLYRWQFTKYLAARRAITGQVTAQVRESCEPVRQFVRWWPGSTHVVHGSPFDPWFSETVPVAWTASQVLHQRYVLRLTVDVIADPADPARFTFSAPRLSLDELQAPPPGSILSMRRVGHWNGGSDIWARLVESGGDLSVLGVDWVEDAPLSAEAQRFLLISGGQVLTLP